jgi:hypothetical protein
METYPLDVAELAGAPRAPSAVTRLEPFAEDGDGLLPERGGGGLVGGRSRVPLANVVQADITALPFRAGALDVVIDLSTLDHLPETEVARAVGEYRRLLRDRSVLLIVILEPQPDHQAAAALQAPAEAAGQGSSTPGRLGRCCATWRGCTASSPFAGAAPRPDS